MNKYKYSNPHIWPDWKHLEGGKRDGGVGGGVAVLSIFYVLITTYICRHNKYNYIYLQSPLFKWPAPPPVLQPNLFHDTIVTLLAMARQPAPWQSEPRDTVIPWQSGPVTPWRAPAAPRTPASSRTTRTPPRRPWARCSHACWAWRRGLTVSARLAAMDRRLHRWGTDQGKYTAISENFGNYQF